MENYMEYPERCALKTILDFVEAGNKFDENSAVAQAAQDLQEWLDKVEAQINSKI